MTANDIIIAVPLAAVGVPLFLMLVVNVWRIAIHEVWS